MDLFTETDDVNGETMIEVWTNTGGDLHVRVCDSDGNGKSIYLRDGVSLAKAILKAAWA